MRLRTRSPPPPPPPPASTIRVIIQSASELHFGKGKAPMSQAGTGRVGQKRLMGDETLRQEVQVKDISSAERPDRFKAINFRRRDKPNVVHLNI